MLTALSLDNAKGEPVTLHEVSGTAKRALISAKGLVGIGALRASKRVRPSAHGAINETRWEDGGVVTLEGEIVGATYAEAEEQFSAVSQVMLETLDSGAALMKYETSGGRKLQMRVKLDSDIEPVLSGVAPRYVYQCSFFAEDPRSYTQTATTLVGAGLTGTAQEATWLQASVSTQPVQVCVDAGHVYWVDGQAKAIGRAAIGGGTIEPEWVKTAHRATALAIDAGHVYWGTGPPIEIGRATIAGATIENSWITMPGNGLLTSLAVNASNIFIGYGVKGVFAKLGRATIAGASVEPEWLVLPSWAVPAAIALDATYIYFGGLGSDINRVTLAGGELTYSWAAVGAGGLTGLFVNATNVFWVSQTRNIGRAKINGTEPLYAFIPGLNPEPYGLAGNTEHLYWGEGTGYIARSKELANGGPVGSPCKVEQTGNRPSPVVFKIKGPVVNPAIVRKSDGARISLYGTIPTGSYIEIDTAKRTLLWNGATSALSYLDAQNTNWGAFEAPNSPGNETYELAATSATAAKLEAIFRGAYA